MITKIYWATRILGYLGCLGGVFLHLHHMQAADPRVTNYGIPLIGAGFLFFFASYAIRAWIRLAPRRPADDKKPPAE
jgi:hypothetical protein